MRNYHRYTKEEEALIINEVTNSPTNLMNAFKKVAKKLKVTPKSVSKHYYSYMQKASDNKMFLTVSSKKASNNYKITRGGKYKTKHVPEKTKKSKWKRILAILAE